MRHSTDRILSTHGGSLPRPDDLDQMIESGASEDELKKRLPSAVAEAVAEQTKAGVDVINDGEYVKAAIGGYGGYMQHRVTGWEVDTANTRPRKHSGTAARDRLVYPGFYQSGLWFS